MSYETLILERRGRVGWLYFNRPERLDAYSVAMISELERAWVELDQDDDVRVIVVSGKGRAFHAGADMKETAASGGGMGERMSSINDGSASSKAYAWENKVWKPVIAAVNGVCAGSGLGHVASADFAIASSSAWFVDPHVTNGQVAALEPISLLRYMPFGTVMRMMLLGTSGRISVEEAFRLGLVTEIVDPPERLEEVVQGLADTIAKSSPAALRHTKQAVWEAIETGYSNAMAGGWKHLVEMWKHPDNVEGPRSFAEGREPVWAPPSFRPEQSEPSDQ